MPISTNGRLRHGGGCAGRRAGGLVVVGQHDRQVVDVHRAVAGELALGPRRAGLVVVGQHDREVVDVHFAVQVGVAGQLGVDRSRTPDWCCRGVGAPAGDVAVIVDGRGVVEREAGGQNAAIFGVEVRDRAVLPDRGVPIAAPVAGDIDPPTTCPALLMAWPWPPPLVVPPRSDRRASGCPARYTPGYSCCRGNAVSSFVAAYQ